MYELKLNHVENLPSEDVIYFGAGIVHLLGMEAGAICGIISAKGLEGFLDSKLLKGLKKSKVKRAVERLLCCGILKMDDGFLGWDEKRYLELNRLGVKVENELSSGFRGIGTYEDVAEYEKMLKFVNKIFKS